MTEKMNCGNCGHPEDGVCNHCDKCYGTPTTVSTDFLCTNWCESGESADLQREIDRAVDELKVAHKMLEEAEQEVDKWECFIKNSEIRINVLNKKLRKIGKSPLKDIPKK